MNTENKYQIQESYQPLLIEGIRDIYYLSMKS